jgi:hypothetical protein
MERLALEPSGAFKRRHGSLRLKGKPPPQPVEWSVLACAVSNLGVEQALYGQSHVRSGFRNAVSALMISRAPHGKAHAQPVPRGSALARHLERTVLMLAREALLAGSMYNMTLADNLLPATSNKELALTLSSTPLLNLEKACVPRSSGGAVQSSRARGSAVGGWGGSAADSVAGLSNLNASMQSMLSGSGTPNVSSLVRDPSGASLSHALTRRSPLAHTADVRLTASQSQQSLLEDTGAPHLKASKSLENLRRAHAVPPLQQQQQTGGRPSSRGMGSKKRSNKRMPGPGGTPSMESLHSGTVARVGQQGNFCDISDSSFLQQYTN